MFTRIWSSLRNRILVLAIAGAVLAAATVLVTANIVSSDEAENVYASIAGVMSGAIAEQLEPSLTAGDQAALSRAARRITERGNAVALVVFDRHRRVAAAEPTGVQIGTALGTWPTVSEDEPVHTVRGVPVQVTFRAIRAGDDEVGGVWVAVDRRAVNLALGRFHRVTVALALVALALCATLAWFAANGIVRPLGALGDTLAAIGRGDPGVRHPAGGPAEVRLLADRANEIADQLEKTASGQAKVAAELDRQIRDRTRQLEQQKRLLSEIAHKDPLTQLDNRLGLERELEKYLSLSRRSGQALALIMMDLDGFKSYNDTWGHAAGDLALSTVGSALRGRARATDVVARFGGDEFCILIPFAKAERAVTAAEGFVAAIVEATRDLPQPGANAHLGASAGVACYPDDGEEGTELLARADAALYRAKAAGKGRVYRAAPPLPDPQA